MTEEESNFIEAARHAGFRIIRRDDTWKLSQVGEHCFIAVASDLHEFGPTIANVLKAERGE